MSAKVQQLEVDLYRVKIANGGTIEFLAGDGLTPQTTGTVRIAGNLLVDGDQTVIGTEELRVEDPTIEINSNRTIGTNPIGVVFARSTQDAYLYFDETINYYAGGSVQGGFVFKNAADNLVGIRTNNINTKGANLYLDLYNSAGEGESGTGEQGIITVNEEGNYELKVFGYTNTAGTEIAFDFSQPDRLAKISDPSGENDAQQALITRKILTDYVRDYHKYNFQDKIASPSPEGDTYVQVIDRDVSGVPGKIDLVIDNTAVSTYYADAINLLDIQITQGQIAPININGDLTLRADGSGSVKVPDPFLLTKYVDPNPGDTDPDAPVDGVKLYSKPQADGGTGLFFINELGTNDELISRNKALLFSIIF